MLRILAADIGGTHSRFALFHAPDTCALVIERELTLAGRDYPDFSAVLKALFLPGQNGAPPFLDAGALPDVTVIAPAGPVQDNICRMPNLPWIIRVQDIREILRIPSVHLINDFAAQAYACLTPKAVDAVRILPVSPSGILGGTPRAGAPVAVMGAGTGFGQALLLNAQTFDDGLSLAAARERFRQVRVLPSEGGHAEFAFAGEEECAFARFVARRVGTSGASRLIGDSVVSGSGLVHLLAFHTGLNLSGREAAEKAPEHPQVMADFARFYARLCRNYVLHTLALGGLYITAGMALRIPVLSHPAFAEEFYNCAAQRHLLEQVPVRHVRNPQAGLWGAAFYGLLQERSA